MANKPKGPGETAPPEEPTPPISSPGLLTLAARVPQTAVTPGFSLYRDSESGLLVFIPKDGSDQELTSAAALEMSSTNDLGHFVRTYSIAHGREVVEKSVDNG